MVMVAIFVLAMLIGAFAISMKTEMTLARNSRNDANLIWAGRSGLELARYVLAQQRMIRNEPYDAMNQKWAGGPGSLASSNSPLASISLDKFPVGENAHVTVHIIDQERKVNINQADQTLLQQALSVMGADGAEIPLVTDAILDWIDPDDATHINGAESDYYQGLEIPYYSKNGPMDDLSELLMVRGVSQDMFWGPRSTNHEPAFFESRDRRSARRIEEQPVYPIGLEEIFTTLSSGRININTAPTTTLQMIPGIDETTAECIRQQRAGPDGADGTEDDVPFANVGELVNCVDQRVVPQISRYCSVQSSVFAVEVDADVGGRTRRFYGMLRRVNEREVQILSFYWKE
jgi:type II secretory pathway component PulK